LSEISTVVLMVCTVVVLIFVRREVERVQIGSQKSPLPVSDSGSVNHLEAA
jgi:hypothetical protein